MTQDPEIRQAWITYMRVAMKFDAGGSMPPMDFDRAVEIVNQEAAKHNMPNAILDEHKLEKYWWANR